MKLNEFVELKGKIKLESGLHIGAGNDEIHIGGIDSPVIKNPLTNVPYIPGSSLKGKMRCLLEQYFNKMNIDSPYKLDKIDGDVEKKDIQGLLICKMFGNGGVSPNYNGGPTRLIISDCAMSNDELLRSMNALTEAKYEVVIDRKKGTAKGGGIRQVERVPAGAEFGFRVVMKVFDGDDKEQMKAFLKLGLYLLQMDCLGGGGSRGNGRIAFELDNDTLDDVNFGEYLKQFENWNKA